MTFIYYVLQQLDNMITNTFKRKDLKYTTSYSPIVLPKNEGKTNNNNIYPNDVIINSLDIADGLKDLLIKHRFTLELLLTISSSELSEILGIDKYIARIICNATKNYVMANTSHKTLQTVNGI
jgi:hypothetical protein